MAPHPYLSSEWIEAVREIRGRHAAHLAHRPRIVINYTITDIPFLDGASAEFHTDVRSPHFFELNHDNDAALAVRTDYETARQLYSDSTWSLDRLREGYGSGSIAIEGEIELIPEWWTEAVGHPDELAMYDEIMMVTGPAQ
jgi:hypothetical protein